MCQLASNRSAATRAAAIRIQALPDLFIDQLVKDEEYEVRQALLESPHVKLSSEQIVQVLRKDPLLLDDVWRELSRNRAEEMLEIVKAEFKGSADPVVLRVIEELAEKFESDEDDECDEKDDFDLDDEDDDEDDFDSLLIDDERNLFDNEEENEDDKK